MPIPFHNLIQDEPSGVAAYLRFVDEPDGKGVRGALLVTSSRGDPLEFSFTRVELPAGSLWPPGLARSRAVSALVQALLESAIHLPDLLLALAAEAPSEVFPGELDIQVPMCLIVPAEEAQHLSMPASLQWIKGQPATDPALDNLVELLKSRQLLLEPFDRAALGIQEAFDG